MINLLSLFVLALSGIGRFPAAAVPELQHYTLPGTVAFKFEVSREFVKSNCFSFLFFLIYFQGKLYTWVPHTDPRAPCSLSCRAANTSLIVQHSARVHDGTRCKPGSLDMCIDGLCQVIYIESIAETWRDGWGRGASTQSAR